MLKNAYKMQRSKALRWVRVEILVNGLEYFGPIVPVGKLSALMEFVQSGLML